MSTAYAAEHRLAAQPASVRAARRVLLDALEAVVDEDRLECLLLATSEVVTNAVEHGAAPIDLRVTSDGGTVRVEVRDGSPLLPRVPASAPGPMQVRGRGMLIVERCSDRWGTEPAGEGKAIWFEVDL